MTTQTNSTSVLDIATLAPTARAVLFTTNDECVLALTQKRADAYVTDYSILLGAASHDPDISVVGSPWSQSGLRDGGEVKGLVVQPGGHATDAGECGRLVGLVEVPMPRPLLAENDDWHARGLELRRVALA